MKLLAILLALLCMPTFAAAQKVDAAFVVGGSFVSDTTGTVTVLPFGPNTTATVQTAQHVFFEGALGVRLLNAHVAALYAEVPIAGIPSQEIDFPNVIGAFDHVKTVFVTPGIRFKFAPASPVSPWASIGGGWAHYSFDFFGKNSKGALQYGGGLDFKTGIPLLGFRAEVRDFLTSDPNTGIPLFSPKSGLHHHNILAGGGIVLRF